MNKKSVEYHIQQTMRDKPPIVKKMTNVAIDHIVERENICKAIAEHTLDSKFIIDSIVHSGYPVDQPIIYETGVTMLMQAASTLGMDRSTFRYLLTLNPDINCKDNAGRTALHFACRAGNRELAHVLLREDNIDINA